MVSSSARTCSRCLLARTASPKGESALTSTAPTALTPAYSFFFATLPSAAEADHAAKALNDQFDKRHTFTCIPLASADALLETPDEFTPPADDDESFQANEHLKGWLTDEKARDQLITLTGDDVEIIWNHKGTTFEVNHHRSRWTEKYCLWSPSGQILATLHAQGIGLWGGPSFSRIHRFPHHGANFIDFSPYDRYLVTLSPIPIQPAARPTPQNPFTEEDAGRHIAIWEVATGRFIRTFPLEQEKEKEKGAADGAPKKAFTWPLFKWSQDEKYFARVVPGSMISIYETPSMRLLNNKSVKIDGVQDFEWAPLNDAELTEVEDEMRGGPLEDDEAKSAANGKQKAPAKKTQRTNTLAYWLPENANQPARVALMSVPSLENLRTKNLFSVADVSLAVVTPDYC